MYSKFKIITFWVLFLPMIVVMIAASLIAFFAETIMEWTHKFEHWAFSEQIEKSGMKYKGDGIWSSVDD